MPFQPAFRGLGGSVEVSRLLSQRRVPGAWQGDPHAGRLERRVLRAQGPTKLEIAVTYRDEDGARRQATIAHDLGIYRDLAYVVPAAEGTNFTD